MLKRGDQIKITQDCQVADLRGNQLQKYQITADTVLTVVKGYEDTVRLMVGDDEIMVQLSSIEFEVINDE